MSYVLVDDTAKYYIDRKYFESLFISYGQRVRAGFTQYDHMAMKFSSHLEAVEYKEYIQRVSDNKPLLQVEAEYIP